MQYKSTPKYDQVLYSIGCSYLLADVTLNCSRNSDSITCMSPAIMRECNGSPKLTFRSSCIVPATICCDGAPIRATPMASESALNAPSFLLDSISNSCSIAVFTVMNLAGSYTFLPLARDSKDGSFTLMSSRHNVWSPCCLFVTMRS